jgi:hypothetical protein
MMKALEQSSRLRRHGIVLKSQCEGHLLLDDPLHTVGQANSSIVNGYYLEKEVYLPHLPVTSGVIPNPVRLLNSADA